MTASTTSPCGHPASDLDEFGECHGTDPDSGEPCWGIFGAAPGDASGC